MKRRSIVAISLISACIFFLPETLSAQRGLAIETSLSVASRSLLPPSQLSLVVEGGISAGGPIARLPSGGSTWLKGSFGYIAMISSGSAFQLGAELSFDIAESGAWIISRISPELCLLYDYDSYSGPPLGFGAGLRFEPAVFILGFPDKLNITLSIMATALRFRSIPFPSILALEVCPLSVGILWREEKPK